MANGIVSAIRAKEIHKSILDNIQQIGKAASVPNDPGANGMFPSQQALERNNIVFFRKVMARLYSLGRVLSRGCCAL